jgi:hypothetical protein
MQLKDLYIVINYFLKGHIFQKAKNIIIPSFQS